MKTHLEDLLAPLPILFATLMLAILFLQSGLDKVFDFKGNLSWLKGHFEKTFMAPVVPLLLGLLTVMELATGVLAVVGIVSFFFKGDLMIVLFASIAAALTFLALFFGQRMAKDYPGAAVIVPYFILDLLLMYMSYNTLIRH